MKDETTCSTEAIKTIRSSIQQMEHLLAPPAAKLGTTEENKKRIRFSDGMKDIHEQKQETKLLYKLDDELLQLRIDIGKLLKALVNKYDGEDALDAAIEDAKKEKEKETKKIEKKVKNEKKDADGAVMTEPEDDFGSEDAVCNAISYEEKMLDKMEKTLVKMKKDKKKVK